MYKFTASLIAATFVLGISAPAFAASVVDNVSLQPGQVYNKAVSDLPYTIAKMQNEIHVLQHDVDTVQAGQAQTVVGPRYIVSATPVRGMFPASTGG